MGMKKYIIALVFTCLSIQVFAQNVDKEVVAFQMNSCVMSLTNLNESQTLATYEKERETLINNLSKEGMARLPEITDLRESILGTIYQLEITQEERQVLKKTKSLEREGEKWRAVSNGLNQAMIFIPGRSGGGVQQAAFYALLTAARSAVDYAASSNESQSEEAKVLWEIRKQDLKQYAWLNTEAYKKINEIFRLYHLEDEYELTPNQASEFNKLIADNDLERRIQKLKNNAGLYKYLNEYNYYLGMAYVQLNEYKKAVQYFETYISNAKKSRIYKIDDKLGCIYLAKLTYEPYLTSSQTEQYITEALRNLPHNGAAYIQCATVYCTKLGDWQKAFYLLRNALYDDMLSDKEAIVMTITAWLPKIKHSSLYETIYNTVCSSIDANSDYISLNSYLHFLIASSDARSWGEIDKLISIQPVNGRIKAMGPYAIKLAKNLDLKLDHLEVFGEILKKDAFRVEEGKLSYTKGYTQAKLEKKFSLFKANPDFIYLFFDYNEDGKIFYVKRSLTNEDFNKLTKTPYEFEGVKSFSFDFSDKSTPDRKALQKIVNFCRKNQSKSPVETIIFGKAKGNSIHKKGELPYLDNYFQGTTSISIVSYSNLPSIDTNLVQYKYKSDVKTQEGISYTSFIPRAYGENHLRVIIKGNKSKDIELIYSISGDESVLVAYVEGNELICKTPLRIISSDEKTFAEAQKPQKAVKEKRSFLKRLESIFKKSSDEPKPIASDKPKKEKKVKEKKAHPEGVVTETDSTKEKHSLFRKEKPYKKQKSEYLQEQNIVTEGVSDKANRKSLKDLWHSILHKKQKTE